MENNNTYEPGSVLYKLDNKGVYKESQRCFIYSGYHNGDGYGIVFGFDDCGKLRKSTGYGSFQYGGNVRLASDKEASEFINEVLNYSDQIIKY